jgi:signal transduction histidine kinase
MLARAIITALDIAVLERIETGLFRLIGPAPTWGADTGIPWESEGPVALEEIIPFLTLFLEDAEPFWRERKNGALHSDAWEQADRKGRVRPMRATAICGSGDRSLLMLWPLGSDYEELRNAVQRMREKSLALERVERDAARLSDHYRRLAERSIEIARLNEIKSEFLAGMSHELRTPLHAIIGFSKLLEQGRAGPLNPKQTDFIRQSIDAAGHLLALINDVLDWSRIETGHLKLEPEVFDLGPLMEEVVYSVRPLALARRVNIETGGAPNRPAVADSRRIRQVLYNLVSNAIKFTPADGLVGVRGDTFEDRFTLEVSDTGIGIPVEEQEAIFNKFYQVRGPGRSAGSGLGLAITKALVEAHGGSIAVHSAPGEGSRFLVTIPQREGEPATSFP